MHRGGELFPKDPKTNLFQLANVPVKDTWAAMEKLVSAGKVRSIGISNFTVEKTEEVLRTAKIPPAVNQVEAHPWLQQPELFDYLKSKVSSPSNWKIAAAAAATTDANGERMRVRRAFLSNRTVP